MQARKAQFRDGIADIARRFGVTVKTLRLYEEMGLLVPVRDGNGWRTYGQAECERLHLLLLLRQLGLPRAAIAKLVAHGAHDLDTVLAVQERALAEQRHRVEESLALVRTARAKLSAGETLHLDALADLVRRTNSRQMRWTPEMRELADRLFTPAQRRRLDTYHGNADDRALWAAIFRDIAALAPSDDPGSSEAADMARRAIGLIRRATRDDKAMWTAMRSFWAEGVADPAVALEMPITKAQWRFFEAAVQAALQAEPAR